MSLPMPGTKAYAGDAGMNVGRALCSQCAVLVSPQTAYCKTRILAMTTRPGAKIVETRFLCRHCRDGLTEAQVDELLEA